MASSDGFHFSQPNKTKVGDMCDLWLLKGPLKNLLHSENKVPCCTLRGITACHCGTILCGVAVIPLTRCTYVY